MTDLTPPTLELPLPADQQVLPPPVAQAETLIGLGIHQRTGLSATAFRAAAAELERGTAGDAHRAGSGVLVPHPTLVPASALTPMLRRAGKPGFVVVDMADVDEFASIDAVTVPDGALYLVQRPCRGDGMAGWTPNAALPAITAAGRSPLLLSEGIAWLLQEPGVLQPGRCFMTIGSRRQDSTVRPDARVPAIWICGGTGRDGPANRGAPKVGWCWAGNRHTWLAFASCAGRLALPTPAWRG